MVRWSAQNEGCSRKSTGRALALKGQGISAEEAGKQISAELKTEHPDWPNTNASGFVKSVYAEPQ